MNPPTVLITGATGRVGSELVRLLMPDAADNKLRLLAAIRRPEQAGRFNAPGLTARHFDYDDLDSYAPALTGVDQLFMVTGYTVDMLGHGKNLVDAAKTAGVRQIVHIGTFHQPGRPQSKLVRHYVWHQFVENYIESSGLEWTHLHPNVFMQNFFGSVSGGDLRMFLGEERVGLVDCVDIARVAAAALRDPERHAQQRYFLSVEALNMREAAAILTEELGRTIVYQPLPAADLRTLLIGKTMESAYFECILRQMEMLQAGRLPDFADVYDNIEQITGTVPTRFRQFVRLNKDQFTAGAP